MDKKKAVILLSGGIDSATVAAKAARDGFDLFPVTFAYGQRHGIEISYAKRILQSLGIVNHVIVDIQWDIFISSSLSSVSNLDIPKNQNISKLNSIPSTYVPARNILFLSYALAYAESIESRDIFIGANSVDYSGYPDCRPEFIKAFEDMANIGTKTGVMGERITIHAPLIHLKKSEIIKLGIGLGLDYSLTHSCYDHLEEGFSGGGVVGFFIRKRGFVGH